MPSSLTSMRSHRQSWPPTQLRLVRSGSGQKSLEPRPLLEDIDEDSLTYFLTPNPEDDDELFSSDDDGAEDDDAMDFDAGIEVAGRPRDLVRSVSPSTLDGLRKLRRRGAASPDFDSDGLTSDDGDDDDGEDYVRLSSSPSPPPRSPGRFNLAVPPRHSSFSGTYPFGFRSRSPVHAAARTAVSSSFPAPTSTAAAAAFGLRGRSTWAAGRGRQGVARVSRPGHLWREPSADVWSIEEETEEELTMSETRGRFVARRGLGEAMTTAKPTKRVRFVLPGEQ